MQVLKGGVRQSIFMRPRHDTSGERRRDGMRRPVSPAQSENQLQRNAGLKAVGVQWDLPRAVARETGAILSLSRCSRGILTPPRRRAFWPGGGPSCARLGELAWDGLGAPVGRAEGERRAPRAR